MTIQDLLNAGFKMLMPQNNFMYGKATHLNEIRSTLQPDFLFTNGNKRIVISTQGGLTEFPTDNSRYNDEEVDAIIKVSESMKIHFIQLKDSDSVVYENYFGVFPIDDILNEFID
jgi:hypothetical protein